MRVYWPHRCPGSGGDKRGPAFQAVYYQLLMPVPPESPLILRSITQITQIFDIMMGHSHHHALLDDHLNKCHLGPTFKTPSYPPSRPNNQGPSYPSSRQNI